MISNFLFGLHYSMPIQLKLLVWNGRCFVFEIYLLLASECNGYSEKNECFSICFCACIFWDILRVDILVDNLPVLQLLRCHLALILSHLGNGSMEHENHCQGENCGYLIFGYEEPYNFQPLQMSSIAGEWLLWKNEWSYMYFINHSYYIIISYNLEYGDDYRITSVSWSPTILVLSPAPSSWRSSKTTFAPAQSSSLFILLWS